MGQSTSGSRTSLAVMRVYGSVIALVSGGYSVYLGVTGMGMPASAWFMLALGVIVVGHGVILLTSFAGRLGRASGPLMIGYAVLMLVNQAWMGMMQPGGAMDEAQRQTMMGVDAGMVAIAILMLASGIIMTSRGRSMAADRMDPME